MRNALPWKVVMMFLGVLLLPAGLVYGDSAGSKSGVAPTSLMLPQGPGSLGGIGENVQANLNMGLMSYRIRIILPKGRSAITPSLNLTYSSSAGSGVVGIGWNLAGGGSVQRLTVRGLPQYNAEDRFYGDTGELVKIPNSPFFRSRVEGSFVRYRWHQKDASDQRGYWEAEFPNGDKGYYGADEKGNLDLNTQVYGAAGTFCWKLRVRIDRNGNRIEYHYLRKNAQLYLERIEWVFSDAGKALYLAELKYEKRPDPISDGKPGFDLKTEQRLSEITVYSEGQRLRSYKLTFEEQSGLSRLKQVTRYGRDPQKAYPVQFSMKYSDSTFSPTNSKMISMSTSVGQDFRARNSDFLDINGDGLPDVLNTAQATHQFHMNTLAVDKDLAQKSHDYPAAKVTQNPQPTNAQLKSATVQLLDVNGDGFTDLVDASNKLIYLNKGQGKWENNSQSLQSFPVDGTDVNMRFFDYNGDKAIDVIRATSTETTYWVSDGKGNWKVVQGGAGIGASFTTDKVRLIDINGDGLVDAVQIFGGKLRYKKYFGYGKWSAWIEVQVPGLSNVDASFVDKAQFADINGDGMADMVAFLGTSIQYFVNKNGVEFAAGQSLKTFQGVDIPDSTQTSIRLADINGNGSRDIVWIDSSGKIVYLELFGLRPNLLTEIANGIGQRIEVTYGSSVYHRIRDESCDPKVDAACAGPWKNKLPMAFVVVNQIKTWAERDGKSQPRPKIQKIYYHDGYYDGIEKKFRGFRKVETLWEGDDSATTRREEHTYNVGDTDIYFHGKLEERVTTDDKKKVYHKETMKWKDCGTPAGAEPNLDPPVRFICMEYSEKQLIEGESDQTKWKLLRTENQYNNYGSVVLQSTLGIKDKQGDERYIRTTFIEPQAPKDPKSNWILGRVQKREVCSALQGPCSETLSYYDGEAFKGLALGQITKGNLTRVSVRVLAGQDKFIDVRRVKFDAHGNIIEKLTPRGMRRTVTWDDVYKRFPLSETIHLDDKTSFRASTTWDYGLSAVTRSTDFNGHQTSYAYDDFGRLLVTALPGDPPDKPSVRYTYELKTPLSRIITEKRSKTGGAFDRKQIQCFDGLGRKLSVQMQTAPGKYLVTGHIEHNSMGLVARSWQAYEGTEACAFLAPEGTPDIKRKYDGLNRRIEERYVDGHFSRTVYGILKKTDYDENDNDKDSPHFNTPKVSLFDGLGRTIEVQTMDKQGHTITKKFTHFSHSIRGRNLIQQVTFPNGSVKKHEFDLLGQVRKLIDPDRGTITYEYSDDGQLRKSTDARGVTTVYTYDLLGRLQTMQEEGKDETRITHYYDTVRPDFPDATNLKTRLVQIAYPGGSVHFSYDKQGNTNKTRRVLLGVPFDFEMTHDNTGRPLTKRFPDGRTIEFVRDQAGRPTSIPGQIASITYDASGRLLEWKAANGVITKYTLTKRKRLQAITVGQEEGFAIQYTHDANGNIRQSDEKHGAKSFKNTYAYDALYRLTRASLQGDKEVLDFKQDDLDNITQKLSSLGEKSAAHVGDYTYDKTKIHAAKQAGKHTLVYDKAGYLTKRDNVSHTWDFMGRLTNVSIDGKEAGRYWYGMDAARVGKEERGLHTWYVTKDYHIRGGAATIYIILARNRVVAYKSRKVAAQFYDDLAPATGDAQLTPKPDGAITAADAWLYHASGQKLLQVPLKKRPLEVDLTRDMLQASVNRLLDDKEESTHTWHVDMVGSVRAVSDEKGTFIARKHYYPYGALMESTGSAFSHGYMGTERDTLTGYNYFQARYMDTRLGRWLSPDPAFARIQGLDDEFNSYGAVKNNPIRMRDFDGFMSSDTAWRWLFSDTGLASAGVFVGVSLIATTIIAAVNGQLKKPNFGALKRTMQLEGTSKLYAASYTLTAVQTTLLSLRVMNRLELAENRQKGNDAQAKEAHERISALRIASAAVGVVKSMVDYSRIAKQNKFYRPITGGKGDRTAKGLYIASSVISVGLTLAPAFFDYKALGVETSTAETIGGIAMGLGAALAIGTKLGVSIRARRNPLNIHKRTKRARASSRSSRSSSSRSSSSRSLSSR